MEQTPIEAEPPVPEKKSRQRRFYFKETDLEMIRWLVEFQYLQPIHFEKLTGGRNIRSLRRRLLQLYRLGYIERQILPLELERSLDYPSDQYVYYLAPKGLSMAQEFGFADENYSFNDEKSPILLPHELKITDFHLTLALAIKIRPELSLIYWEQRRSELQDYVIDKKGEHLSINPDAFFGMKNAAKLDEESTRHYFLEIIRARESDYQPRHGLNQQERAGESYLMRKMRAFTEYKLSGKFAKEWDPLKDFSVITILPSPLRVANFCLKMAEEKMAFQRFLVSHFNAYSLEQPESILGRIFWTPKEFERQNLIPSAPNF
jgi:hypothetical protein